MSRIITLVIAVSMHSFDSTLIQPKSIVTAYEWSVNTRKPEITRRAMAGIWKLTPYLPNPVKEFTVYPKKPKIVIPELVLLLKEDGSFQQYNTNFDIDVAKARNVDTGLGGTGCDTTTTSDIDQSWKNYQMKSAIEQTIQQQQDTLFPWVSTIKNGRWDYIDGNLLLAADRSTTTTPTTSISTTATSSKSVQFGNNLKDNTQSSLPSSRKKSISSSSSIQTATESQFNKNDDTLLKGRVIANYQTRLTSNPILASSSTTPKTGTSSNKKVLFDTHLSVPRGSINIGKFMYPKHHPSFFEQPMFQPIKMGNFALRQILGTLNVDGSSAISLDDNNDESVTKYHRSDFYNKTFLLTSHPLRQFQSSGSNKKKNNSYDKYNKKRSNNNNNDNDMIPTSVVRVLQIAFHPNNTFSTTGGLGNAAILRGKFDIVGTDLDHLWMQVIRFGFGRSVSGSVYSEGPMLSHEDIKAYWGTIRKYPKVFKSNVTKPIWNGTTSKDNSINDIARTNMDNNDPSSYRIEVEGSVLDGLGLEPMPVARFILREIDPILNENDTDDDDDDEEDAEDEIDRLKSTIDINITKYDDGIDWTSSTESFQ